MINVSEILSEVQNVVNDIANERIQHGEYISMLNSIAVDIASSTEIYINRYIAVPNPLTAGWQQGINYYDTQIVYQNGNYYICVSAHFSSDWNADLLAGRWRLIPQWQPNTSYNIGDLVWIPNRNFYRAIVNHTSDMNNMPPNVDFWYLFSGGDTSILSVKLPYVFNANTNFAAYKLLRVVRGVPKKRTDKNGIVDIVPEKWVECYEYSSQAVSTSSSNNYPFGNNRILSTNAFTVQFADIANTVDNSLNLVFAKPFEYDEIVVIDYISNRPWGTPGEDVRAFTQWFYGGINTQYVPDFLANVFKWGLQWKACERLYFQGDEMFLPRMQIAEEKYRSELHKASAYAKNFKDNRSVLRAQPLNWLPK